MDPNQPTESTQDWLRRRNEVVFISDDPAPPVFRDISDRKAHPDDAYLTKTELEWLGDFYQILELDSDHGSWFRTQLWETVSGVTVSHVWNVMDALAEIEKRPRRFICIDEVCMKVTAWNALKDYPHNTTKVFDLIDRYLREFHRCFPTSNIQILAHSLHLWGGLDKAILEKKVGRIEAPLCILLERLFPFIEDLAAKYSTSYLSARSA
jgi:hypothetical protein